MILSTHLVVGATVGSQIGNPAAAFTINLMLHYLLDSLPHWDYLDKVLKKDVPKILLDFIIGIVLLIPLYWLFSPSINLASFLLGAAAAVLPDFLQGMRNLFHLDFLQFHSRFHHFIHFEKNQPFVKGFGIQLAFVIISVIFLLFRG